MAESFVLHGVPASANTPVASASAPAESACSDIIELRQYTLHPGRRDAFVTFFEREFIETQEAAGNSVIGQFRDLDNADRFTWLRGFRDMSARAAALQAFYGGDVWKSHRDEANAFFIDTDNVLLLRAVRPQSALDPERAGRAPPEASADPPGLLVATIHSFDARVDPRFVDLFEQRLRPALAANGMDVRGYYTSENTPNNFPRLPVRDSDHVFVWFALFDSTDDYARRRARFEATPVWRNMVAPQPQGLLKTPAEVLRLAPTPRSRLHR
jgi:NIPSNAP